MSFPSHVFLCHASEDKPFVRKLRQKLKSSGIKTWLDEEDLMPGQPWESEIEKAVKLSAAVVVCLSQKAISKEGYVQKEIRFALDAADQKPEGTIFIIPARLDDSTVPQRLSRWQWVDLFSEDGYERLVKSIRKRLRDLEPQGGTEKAVPVGLEPRRGRGRAVPVAPASRFPLAEETRAAYVDLYAKIETEIENTADVALLRALNTSQADVNNVLTMDAMYRLHADTAQFAALLKQINHTNDGLKTLQDQIGAIASHVAQAGAIHGAISKVLKLVAGVRDLWRAARGGS